jgi:hypothetical protein
MYNNTLTSTKQYALTSSFEVHYAMPIVQKWNIGIGMEMSVSEAGYLFSIELNREKIKSELCDFFRFKSKNKELDFLSLSSNQELRKLLPSIGSFFKNQWLYMDYSG